MKVQFVATFDDMRDVTLRSLHGSKAIAARRRRSWFLLSIGLGLFTFVLFPASIPMKLVFGVTAALLAAVIYPLLYRRSLRGSIREILREQMGAVQTFLVEVEVDAKGVTFRQMGTQVTYEWSTVTAVGSTDDRIDFHLKGGGVATVRERAFESPEHRLDFLEQVHNYQSQASQPAQSIRLNQ